MAVTHYVELKNGAKLEFRIEIKTVSSGRIFGPNDEFWITSSQSDPQSEDANIRKNSAVYVEVTLKHTAKESLKIGYRQAIRINRMSALYAGIKSEDGSIVQGTRGLNMTWMIDSEFERGTLLAPFVPYAQKPQLMPPDNEMVHVFSDTPNNFLPTTRQNSITRKRNYLISINDSRDFATYWYVEDMPVLCFTWNYEVTLDIPWEGGSSQIPVGRNAVAFGELSFDKIDGKPGFSKINVATADQSDHVGKKLNEARNDAQKNRKCNPSYGFDEFEEYSSEVRSELQSMQAAKLQFKL